MTESVVADFTARVVPDSGTHGEPVRGRVVLSRKRLVFATDEWRTTVPLSAVFDVAIGHVPPGVSEFFDDTVTIGYVRNGERMTAVVESDGETIDRFTRILFKARLNGTEVTVKHPAKVGGRVVDAPTRTATLRIGDRSVGFTDTDEPFTIDLVEVTRFERADRTINGRVRSALRVRHMVDRTAVTSEIALDSGRKMNVLGRYLRLEYADLVAEISDLEITDEEMKALVALYSGGGDADLARLLGTDANGVSTLVDSLGRKGLATRNEDGPTLTSLGRLAVGDRVEDVSA